MVRGGDGKVNGQWEIGIERGELRVGHQRGRIGGGAGAGSVV
jgi:hypothetical protein